MQLTLEKAKLKLDSRSVDRLNITNYQRGKEINPHLQLHERGRCLAAHGASSQQPLVQLLFWQKCEAGAEEVHHCNGQQLSAKGKLAVVMLLIWHTMV